MNDKREGWIALKPEKLPEPTHWPAAVGLGMVLICLGLLTRPAVFWVGLGLFALGIGKWAKEIWDEA